MTIRVLQDQEEVVTQAAEHIVEIANQAVRDHNYFFWALAGGSTPCALYQALAQNPWKQNLPWEKTFLFFGDERCLPLSDEHSNFRMVKECMLAAVPLPQANVFPAPIAAGPPQAIARKYEEHLRAFVQTHQEPARESKEIPVFDLILLGLGADGHTASLFPGDIPALEETKHWVVAVYAPRGNPPGHRITLTLPVLNHAKQVMFLATGEVKKEILANIIQPKKLDTRSYPASPTGFYITLYITDAGLSPSMYVINTVSPSDFSFTITEWGGVGGAVMGTFSGTLDLGTGGAGSSTVAITNGRFEAQIKEGTETGIDIFQ